MYEVKDTVINGKVMYYVVRDGEKTGWYSPFKSEMDEMARIQNERGKEDV